MSSTTLILFCFLWVIYLFIFWSVLHVMSVLQAPPAPLPWVMKLMHSTCVITFPQFLRAAAKIQTSKKYDMNTLFKETIVIFSSNTSVFILLLQQLLNSCGVY